VSLTRKSLIALVAATVVLALLALPGNAAPEKQFSLRFPTSVGAGIQNITVPLKNETPNGNSNINSFRITATSAPAGFSINSITQAPASSHNNKTISVTGINTLKPQQIIIYTLNITVPNLGCAGGTPGPVRPSRATPSTGTPSGCTRDGSESVELTTSISTGCTTISVNKYEDANANRSKAATEGAPTQSFSFVLKRDHNGGHRVDHASEVATFTPCRAAPTRL
jgi:hypothetical protein